jgi:hypothetical protein
MGNHAGYCDASSHQASSIIMKPLDGRAVDALPPGANGSSAVVVEPNPLPQRQLFLIWYPFSKHSYVDKHNRKFMVAINSTDVSEISCCDHNMRQKGRAA